MRPFAVALLGLLVTFPLTGCSGASVPAESVDADSEALAQDGTDTSATESQTESIAAAFLAPTTLNVDEDVTTLGALFRPSSCVAVSDGTSSDGLPAPVYVLTGCTGPLGADVISGTLDVVVTSVTPTTLALAITSEGTLTVGRATVTSLAATAILTAVGPARTMDWNVSTMTGITAHGRPFVRSVNKNLAWTLGGGCVTVNGGATGVVGARDLTTTVTNLERCGGCPASGAIRVENDATDRAITLAYDGSDVATFTAADGVDSEILLACTP